MILGEIVRQDPPPTVSEMCHSLQVCRKQPFTVHYSVLPTQSIIKLP